MTKLDIQPLRAELVMDGEEQIVRLPKGFRIEGEEVTMRREGDAVILEPVAPKSPRTEADLDAMWARIDALLGGEFPDREQPPMQERDFDW
ncbi:AbrB family transcriptional regulator [Caulobacter sp. Root656]|nr:AbrB family transcriptional regulator [Caulobacter sp. Root656]